MKISSECFSHFCTSAVYLINVYPLLSIQIPHITHSWFRIHALNTQVSTLGPWCAILRLKGVVLDQVSWMTASNSWRQVKIGVLDWQAWISCGVPICTKKTHFLFGNTVQCTPVIWRIARLKHTDAFGCTAGHTRLVSPSICQVYGHNIMVRSKSVVSLGLQIDT